MIHTGWDLALRVLVACLALLGGFTVLTGIAMGIGRAIHLGEPADIRQWYEAQSRREMRERLR